jgi:ketosteroid isomerase-like protein
MYKLGQARGAFPYDRIIMSPKETVIVSDTVAYDYGTSKVYYTNEAGEEKLLTNSYLVILKKDNKGSWRLHREVASGQVK